jgi:hypothetical protein
VLTDWSNLGKTAFLTIEASLFQKTFNRKLIALFSRFPDVTYMPKCDKRQRSYECRNTRYMQKKISEAATLATSFHNPKQWSARLHPFTKDPRSHPQLPHPPDSG